LQVLIQFGFDEHQINRMECQVVAENAASVKLFQKLGFQEEGVLRRRLFINQQFRDMLSLGLLRQDVKSENV
jgi:ribosomal-protein-alanine N-acetyltransferase